jgi:hypothetical protein
MFPVTYTQQQPEDERKTKKKKDFSFSRVVLRGNKRKTLSTPMLIRIFDSKFNFSYFLSFFIWGPATL